MNSGVPKELNCQKCNKAIPQTIQRISKCKCGNLYCKDHKFPEHHDCTFDYFEENKQRLLRQNPQIETNKKSTPNTNEVSGWDHFHKVQHPCKMILRFHTGAFLLFILLLIRSFIGLIFGMTELATFPWFFKQILWGYFICFFVAHALPCFIIDTFYKNLKHCSSAFGGCSYCFFSYELQTQPKLVLKIENHMILDAVLELVTYKKTNCLSHLYNNPSWKKTFDAVVNKVSNN